MLCTRLFIMLVYSTLSQAVHNCRYLPTCSKHTIGRGQRPHIYFYNVSRMRNMTIVARRCKTVRHLGNSQLHGDKLSISTIELGPQTPWSPDPLVHRPPGPQTLGSPDLGPLFRLLPVSNNDHLLSNNVCNYKPPDIF